MYYNSKNPSPNPNAQIPNPNSYVVVQVRAIATSVKYLVLSRSESNCSTPIEDKLGTTEPEVMIY